MAWPPPFAAVVNSGSLPFEPDGVCRSVEVEQSLRLVAAEVVEFSQMRIRDSSARDAEPSPALLSSNELAERMAQTEMTFRLLG
jgi:hypothetical protein